jgi:hypothetical protein
MPIDVLRIGQELTPRNPRLNRFVPNPEIAFERTMRIRILPSLRALFLTALAGSAASSQAGTVVSNLGEGETASPFVNGSVWNATSFTTDVLTYTLNSLTLRLSFFDFGGGTVTPRIFTNGSGAPSGVALEVFSSQTVNGSGNFTFASTGLTLDPNTTYWIALQGGGFDASLWASTSSPAQTGGWTIGDTMLHSTDSGSSWPTTYGFSGQFSVDATPVPEPRSVLLLGMGAMAGLTFLRRSARRRA